MYVYGDRDRGKRDRQALPRKEVVGERDREIYKETENRHT